MHIPQLKWITLGALLVAAFAAQAEVHLDNVYVWRRAKTLPAGQQIFSLQSSYQNISDRYSADGRVEPVGNQYARALTWNQLMQADPVGRAELKDYMNQNGLGEGDIAATSAYQIHREQLGFGVNWAYGLMSNWMIGVTIPITLTTTRVQQSVEMTPQLSRGAGQIGQKSVLGLSKKDLRERIRELAQQELSNSGYDRIPTQKQSWDVGDISLLSQEVLLSKYHWSWALQQVIRFPTAQNPSVSDYIQTSQDEGPVDVGVSSLLDLQVRRLIFGFRGGYVAQMPDSARMRAAATGASPAGVDPKVNRNLGDWIWTAVDSQIQVTRKFGLSAEYSFLSKGKDRYSGSAFTEAEYEQMAEHTDQQLHQTRVGLFYRLGGERSRSGIASKWMASMDYTYPWIGRNSSEAAQTSLELINYF